MLPFFGGKEEPIVPGGGGSLQGGGGGVKRGRKGGGAVKDSCEKKNLTRWQGGKKTGSQMISKTECRIGKQKED